MAKISLYRKVWKTGTANVVTIPKLICDSYAIKEGDNLKVEITLPSDDLTFKEKSGEGVK